MPEGGLTRRESQCVQLAGLGLSNAEVAHSLGLTPSTVANYLQSAYAKLGVNHRQGAAQQLGIRYPGSLMTDDEVTALLPRHWRPAAPPGVEGVSRRPPWLATVWRAPPSGPMARVGLAVLVAVLWLLVLSGAIPLLVQIFDALNRWRPS
jgi:DNA-binding CsgD family transcriptional regulator